MSNRPFTSVRPAFLAVLLLLTPTVWVKAAEAFDDRIIPVQNSIPNQFLTLLQDESPDLTATATLLAGSYGLTVIRVFDHPSALLLSGPRTAVAQMGRDARVRYVAEYDGGVVSAATKHTFSLTSVEEGLRASYLSDSVVQSQELQAKSISPAVAGKPGSTSAQFRDRMTRAHLVGRSLGYASAIPNFNCADYPDDVASGWTRRKCGTILLNSIAAEYRMVTAADLGNPSITDPGAIMRAVNGYGAARGYPGGYPTFQVAYDPPASGGKLWYAIVLLRSDAVEWRDIPRSSLGNSAFDDWGQRFRDVYTYAGKNDFIGGAPNGNQADYGKGVVYGTYFFRSSGGYWWDAPGIIYGEPDQYSGSPQQAPTIPVSLRRHNPGLWDCGLHADIFTFCGDSIDPIYRGGNTSRATISRVTNRTGYTMDISYTDPQQRAVGQTSVANNDTFAAPFATLYLGGRFTTRLAQSASNLTPDQSVLLDVEYLDPSSAVVSGPTPYPQAPSAPSTLLYYRIASASAEAKVIDLNANSCAGGAPLILWPALANADNQLVQFVPAADNSMSIRIKSSGLVFDVVGGGAPAASGTGIQQYASIPNAPNQRFYVQSVGSGSFRISPLSSPGKVVSIDGASTLGGSRIVVTDWDSFRSNYDQQWRLEPTNLFTFSFPFSSGFKTCK